MNFLYKTRASVNPKGKPRVYFTCHPKDFARYFDKLCEDILAAQDCAVYYAEDMSAAIDEAEQDTSLGQMNLFVVPVTLRLLTTPNRAMDADIAYAKQNNIPILPFMMESGIDEVYSLADKFGERQYLTPYAADATQVSYADKLKQRLESLLISSDLADRIRGAFDAYVFLSYRKKDRRYANQLMKTIHSIEEFRDVAIWYDEFLTPGESFSENIARVLANSKLFAMVVTPHLLEEKNYVKDVEYPMAMENQMKVVPAEMMETDREALALQFSDIPDCVNPDDLDALSAEMLDSLLKGAVADGNRSPEHVYLMGLAYLEGVDVEVNRQRGLELITEAAEAGYPEAMEKLYRLYSGEDGDGFRNQRKALPWGEKVVAYNEATYGATHHKTLVARARLAATYSALRQYDKARDVLEEVLRIRRETLGDTDALTLLAMHNLAVEYMSLNEYAKAAEMNEAVYAARCTVLGEAHPDTLVTLCNLAQALFEIGEKERAIALQEKAYRQSRETAGDKDVNTMTMLDALVAMYHHAGRHREAAELAERAYAAHSGKYGETSAEACDALAQMAKARCAAADFVGAYACWDRAIALCLKLNNSLKVQVLLNDIDTCAGDMYMADENEAAVVLWCKEFAMVRAYYGLWSKELLNGANRLLRHRAEANTPALKEMIQDCIYETLQMMGDAIVNHEYEGGAVACFQQMHKLMQLYEKAKPQLRKLVSVLETMYNLCCLHYYADGKPTLAYKEKLDRAKALLDE